MRFGHRGAERRDRIGDPGLVERDHVHLPFDHDHPLRLAAGGCGMVEIEQGTALVEQGRVGRVQIFGLALAEDPGGKGDHPPARVADRKGDAAAEPVIRLAIAVLGRDQQPGLDQPFDAEFLERPLELAAPIRGEAEAEAGRRRGAHPALVQIGARLSPLDAAELIDEPGLRRLHDAVEPGRSLGPCLGPRIGGGHLHPGGIRKLLHRIHEGEPARIGQPADRIAMRLAAEAMIEALLVIDVEARRLLVVKRAARLELPTGAGELGRAGDQRGKQGAGAQLVEEGGGEGHDFPSCLWPGRPSGPQAGGGTVQRFILPSRLREGLGVGPHSRLARSRSARLPYA